MRYADKVVSRTDEMLLVEYMDGGVMRRAWVPADVPNPVREAPAGIQVGVYMDDLEKLLSGHLTGIASRLEHALHVRGLYTAADVSRIPEPGAQVLAALRDAVAPLAAEVVELLRQEV